jgi:hypothetical protein
LSLNKYLQGIWGFGLKLNVSEEFVSEEQQWLDVNSDNPELATIVYGATDTAELWKIPPTVPQNVKFLPNVRCVAVIRMLILWVSAVALLDSVEALDIFDLLGNIHSWL